MASTLKCIEFPDPSSSSIYREQVAAWVRFKCTSFSTLATLVTGSRVMFADSPNPKDNYILPLQRYSAPNVATYEDVEPSAQEMAFGAARDLALGDPQKLEHLLSAAGANVVFDTISGAAGESTRDSSLSDLNFKSTAKRVHSFGFSLYAKNAKDAENLDIIANGFQTRLYPFLATDTRVKPPPMWNIQIVPNGGKATSKVLSNDIGLCILNNVSISRLDKMGPVLTTNDYFLGLDITASFTEIEPTYRSWTLVDGSDHERLKSRSRAAIAGGGLTDRLSNI
jgi:hypothetical protein